MRIAVMGAGGVGGYFGARLAQAGHEVAFVARGRHLEAIRQKGLSLKSPLGDATIRVQASDNPAELGTAEVVLFAVKLWDTESAAERIRPLVEKGGVVIPFQNGVESIERIGKVLGAERVMGGAAYIAGRIGEPGVIVQTGTMARLRFGPVLPAQRKTAQAFLAACQEAKIDAELTDDIVRVLWEKFVLLVAVSATTTVTRSNLGVVRADPDLIWLLEACMRETWALGRKKGVKLADDLVEQTMKFAEGLPAEMRASMAADLEAGGRLEAPWLSGAVARMSREAGLEASANCAVYAALKSYVNGDCPRPMSRLKDALLDPQHKVLLYGTTPPRAGADEALVAGAAQGLVQRVRGLPLDGLVVYDIQDESGRTSVPRPFAFTGTIDPRAYAQRLMDLTGLPAITYKCVGEADEALWKDWLGGTGGYGVEFLSIVGRPTSGIAHALPLSQAIRLAAAHPADYTVGGVVIAERHTTQRSEAARMLAKSLEGCSYFISQTVYHAHATERLLAAYARDCRGAGVKPRRVVLTFAPVGREKTMAFLRWLGVRIADETQAAILGAPRPLAKSIDICRDNLRRILAHDWAREIPLGVNVESVSINRDELDASVELFHALAEVLAERR